MSGAVREGAGGSAAGGGGPAAAVVDPPPWALELRDAVKEMAGAIKAYATPKPTAPQPEPDEPDLDDVTLETLPRARFAEHVANKTVKHLEKTVINPLKSQLERVTQSTSIAQLAQAVNEARAKYPDLDNFKDKMVELANRHPTLAPEDLYLLANPKARRAGTKEETKEPDDSSKTAQRKIRFGGIKPTNGGDGDGGRKRNMAPQEAINAAWAETVAALGGEPEFEE